MNQEIYIGVGSNINPLENIKEAFALLKRLVKITASSSFYRTPPFNIKALTPDYLNGIWQIESPLHPKALKTDVLENVENQLGRIRTDNPDEARTIDLDLILYGDIVSKDPQLPDPDVFQRNFIILPLLEIAEEEKIIPGSDKSLRDVARNFTLQGMKKEQALSEYLKTGL